MRFPIISLLLFTSSLAAPIETRSNSALEPIYNVYERCVHKIIDRQKQLSAAILDLDPRLEGAYTKQQILIEERANDIIKGYSEGKSEILNLARNMYPQGGYNFEKDGHVKHILDSTYSVLDVWVLRKPSIFKAGGQVPILGVLRNTKAASDEFSKAMIIKAPAWDVVYGNGDKRFKDYANAVSARFDVVIREFENRR